MWGVLWRYRTLSKQRVLALLALGTLLRRGVQPAFWVLEVQRGLSENLHLGASSQPPSQVVLSGDCFMLYTYFFIHLMLNECLLL